MKKGGLIIGVATNLVITIGSSFWIGNQLDGYFEMKKPIFTLIIGLVGMVSALIFTNKQMNKLFKNEK